MPDEIGASYLTLNFHTATLRLALVSKYILYWINPSSIVNRNALRMINAFQL